MVLKPPASGTRRSRWLNMIWPEMGWRRYFSFMRHRLGRMEGTPHSIAAGFACGAALSLTPLIGLHLGLSLALAWLIRANVLAAAIGTLLGNPWTYPFFFYWTYKAGNWFLGFEGEPQSLGHLSFAEIWAHPYDTLLPVLWPMAIGCLPFVIMVWWLAYWALYKVISRYKRQRQERRHRRALLLMQRIRAHEDNRKD